MMQIIETSPTAVGETCREMTRFEQMVYALKSRVKRLRRKLPYLVWYNDELDVTVTLSQDKLDPEAPMEKLFSGAFYECEKVFRDMGIGFDTGMGADGRDWEWDWSLKGPISVRFRSRATKPELRMERKRPEFRVVK